MEIEIVRRRENPLLKRVEVAFKAVHRREPTPPRDVLRTELARALKATKDVVVLDRARSLFGRFETAGYAKVYKSKDVAAAIERRHVLVRNKLLAAEAKPAGAAPAAKPEKPAAPPAPKKEAPKEEPKPEKPAKAEKAAPKEEKREEKKEERKPPAKAEKPDAKKPEAKKAEPKRKEGK